MAITYVTAGAIKAVDINQALNALSKETGQTDVGQYHIGGNAYAIGAKIEMTLFYISRQSVAAVAVSIDAAIQAPNGFSIGGITNFGCLTFQCVATAINANMNAQGNYTVQF